MADGTSRAVEAIHAGDYVLAKDEKTGKVEAQEVTATVHHPAATLVTVTFAGADGKTQAIVCTPEHPFFVDGKGWVEAGSLGIGTSIVTRAGPTLAVKGLDWKRSAQAKPGLTTPAFTVYNFTVDASHTFFVGTANGGAWTHNDSCALLQAVKDLHDAKFSHPISNRMNTTAILVTDAGEFAATNVNGAHAEPTAVINALENGVDPSQMTDIGISRAPCKACAMFLEQLGVKVHYWSKGSQISK